MPFAYTTRYVARYFVPVRGLSRSTEEMEKGTNRSLFFVARVYAMYRARARMVAKSSEFDARMEIANRPGNCSPDSIVPRLDGEK